jgi:hypothetical protein
VCVIALKPKDVTISDDIIRNCWIRNSDGGGYVLSDNKKIIAKKGLMTLKEFHESYRKDEATLKSPTALLHFRIRSAGDRSPENTHPFPTGDGGWMAHNGTFSAWSKTAEKKSDTALFMEEFGKDFTFPVISKMKLDLGDAIGFWNKLAFLWKNHRYIIVNERHGEWSDGLWFSNNSYQPSRFQVTQRSTAYPYGIDDY